MTNSEIQDILKMRMNIYAAGINARAWKDINTAGASDMMAYLFPKSGQLAYYQLKQDLFLLKEMRRNNILLKRQYF